MKKITLFKYLLSAILLLGFLPNMFAQRQNANWYFGNQAGINFNDGTAPATLLSDGLMNTPAGSASVSDDFGSLLFYTDGVTVWNKNHIPMSNGNLIGDVTVSQSAVIIPNPANAAQYYIFSNSAENMGHPGLRYSVVDMTLEEGLGNVDSMAKDVSLLTSCSEKMTAIINKFENTYWLVAFGPSSDPMSDLSSYNSFYSFKIDLNGDVNMPIESNFSPPPPAVDPNNPLPGEFDRNNPIHMAKYSISIPFQQTSYAYAPYAGGQMKISPDSNTLALVHNVDDRGESADALFAFEFSPISGLVTKISSHYMNYLFNYANTYYYGLEFSPDSQQIFVSTFEQDDNGYGTIIRARNFAQGETPTFTLLNIPENRDPVFSLQLSIDGQIYASRGDFSFLDIITQPNDSLVEYNNAGYLGQGFDLGSKIAGQGLPQLVPEVVVINSKPADLGKKASKPIIKENPFKNELKLKFKYIQDYTIEYYDSMGVLIKTEVYEMTNRQIHKVDTQAWGDGIYYVKITGAETSDIFYNTAIKAQ